MREILLVMLGVLIPAVVCKDDESVLGLADAIREDMPYDDLPFPMKRACDVIEEKNNNIKDTKLTTMARCLAKNDMDRNLLRLVVARNKGKKFKITAEDGQTMEVTPPTGWFVPQYSVYQQKFLCTFRGKSLLDPNHFRPLVPH